MAAMRAVPRVAVADARLHGGDEALEADGGELAQQARQVAEMVLGRRVRDAGFARRRAQGEAVDAVTLQDALGRLQQRLAQRAVVVAVGPIGLGRSLRMRGGVSPSVALVFVFAVDLFTGL